MKKDIAVTTRRNGDAAVIYIKGDVTAVTGAEIEQACKSSELAAARRVVFCFGEGCYINSGGLEILMDVITQCRGQHREFFAAGLSDHFCKIFRMVGLTQFMKLVGSEEDALAAGV